MARPDGGLIQETNAQYYAGAQTFIADGTTNTYTTTFNTNSVSYTHLTLPTTPYV